MVNKTLLNFKKYFHVGVLNTLIHWGVFYIIYHFTQQQSLSNLCGFLLSVTFSYFANAKYTFNSEIYLNKYLLYVLFMGSMSYSFGYIAQKMNLPSLITLISFSAFSFFVGFIFSKKFIFKNDKV